MKHLLLISIILFSCNAEKNCIKYTNKAIKGGCLKADTTYVHDTLFGFSVDTTVVFDTLSKVDTLIVEQNGVKVKTVIQWKERIVNQKITERDTIITKQIIKNNVECPKFDKWEFFWKGAACAFLVIIILLVLYNKFLK